MRKVCLDNPSKGLSFLYNNKLGRIILKPLVKSKTISKLSGYLMDSKLSIFLIKPFIKANDIDLNLYENKKYNNFNDFFTRKIKEKNRLISCCDSKLTVYKIDKNLIFKVKNTNYNLSSLLKDDKLAKEYTNGNLMVFRLSPDDYHRYCFIDDSKLIKTYNINGLFHSVNPVVYDNFEVFKENTRCVSILKTDNFNDIIYVEVGALLVGKIKNHDIKSKIKKGMEKGYFMYGGSTVIIITKKDIVKIDDDILNNSKKGLETYVKYGEKIGNKIIK